MAPETLAALIGLQEMEFSDADDADCGRKIEKQNRLRQLIPEELLEMYDVVKERYSSSTLVRVNNGACDGCHIVLPAERTIEVANNIFVCEHCGRILYSSDIPLTIPL